EFLESSRGLSSAHGSSRSDSQAHLGRPCRHRIRRCLPACSCGKGDLVCVFDDFPPFLRTAAGINTTAEGIARWIIALQVGKLLKQKSSLAALWTPGVLNDGSCGGFGGPLPGYALGWPMTLPPEERALGGIGGGRSAFFVYPDHDLAVVILTNLQGASPHLLAFEVARQYVPSLSPSE